MAGVLPLGAGILAASAERIRALGKLSGTSTSGKLEERLRIEMLASAGGQKGN